MSASAESLHAFTQQQTSLAAEIKRLGALDEHALDEEIFGGNRNAIAVVNAPRDTNGKLGIVAIPEKWQLVEQVDRVFTKRISLAASSSEKLDVIGRFERLYPDLRDVSKFYFHYSPGIRDLERKSNVKA